VPLAQLGEPLAQVNPLEVQQPGTVVGPAPRDDQLASGDLPAPVSTTSLRPSAKTVSGSSVTGKIRASPFTRAAS